MSYNIISIYRIVSEDNVYIAYPINPVEKNSTISMETPRLPALVVITFKWHLSPGCVYSCIYLSVSMHAHKAAG